MPTTIADLARMKREGKRFAMLTAYDWPTARLLTEAGIPVLLVGDSVADNVLGYANTIPVTMAEMLHHARAVARGAPDALLIGDMPFGSYQSGCDAATANAVEFLKAGMHAVKVEGGGWVTDVVAHLTRRSIPVMGHLGLTPQSVHAMSGLHVQGRDERQADRIFAEAEALQRAGVFALVLEGIPRPLAARVTEALGVPTIGIGAGPDCDAQVLVTNDVIGVSSRTRGPLPKFVRAFADVGDRTVEAARAFAASVGDGTFPDDAHSYH